MQSPRLQIAEQRSEIVDRVLVLFEPEYYSRDEWFLKNLDVPHLREVIKESKK